MIEKDRFYEDTERNTLYKTENGVEIRPSIRVKHEHNTGSSNQTYYYVWYAYNDESGQWDISTNELLYGEKKVIVSYLLKEDAEKAAHAINDFIHLLIRNI